MALNNYNYGSPMYPGYYPPGYPPFTGYYPPYSMQPQAQNAPQPQAVSAQPAPIQNAGFANVQSEEEARKWPIAPNNSMTFKNENAPYLYTKTAGASALEEPRFKRFRLVEEEETMAPEPAAPASFQAVPGPAPDYVTRSDLAAVHKEIRALYDQLDALTEKKLTPVQEGE